MSYLEKYDVYGRNKRPSSVEAQCSSVLVGMFNRLMMVKKIVIHLQKFPRVVVCDM